ncbi:MAG TPA: hypothetical protein VFH73_12225 [Polyangia bacterium]|nr:hypothetical protein [Polyangia bacterium]
MPILKIIFVAAALVACLGRYFQEMHRISVVKRLPPADARQYFESTRQRGETMMLVVTVVVMALGVAAVLYTFVLPRS